MAGETGSGRNRLANETSPYLLQHADNPVDWYPWGEEAFARARAEDKPILLSIGYSTCHWCHVMAHESFESPEIAALMNEHFVSVKVDREERPDLDGVYMTAVQALTGQGGWPMTVFLTPERKPFYAGTYFPPDDRFGRPGFPRVLAGLHAAWTEKRDDILQSADEIAEHLQAASLRDGGGTASVTPELPAEAVGAFRHAFDAVWGGFGTAPKFPSPGNLEFLLARLARNGEDGASPAIRDLLATTLDGMASGGMYDQLGGGFARYSVDVQWLIPHFEKMLYDNALLARTYLHAAQVSAEERYERVVRETLAYLEREMLSPEGGFYSAQDADSEGVEGKFFVWTVEELRGVLGDDADLAAELFDVTPEGNFHDPHHPELTGRSVISRRYDLDAVAERLGITPEDLEGRAGAWRRKLFEARSERIPPGTDDKVLTSWNGLALAAFADAARVFGDVNLRAVAERNAAFVREQLWREGVLLHTYKDGVARIDGMLEDYAFYGLGLVELYKLTGDLDHLRWAGELFDAIVARFHDEAGGGFFETPEGAEELLFREKSLFDSPYPSGNAAAALLGLWLERYGLRSDGTSLALEVVALVQEHLLNAPSGFGGIWQVVEMLLTAPRELAIVGEARARAPFERVAGARLVPWLAIAPARSGAGLPLLEERDPPPGEALAYLCENMVCNLPAATPDALAEQLAALEIA